MAGENQRLYREKQGLNSQYQRMHHADRIYDVKKYPFRGAQSFVGKKVVIVGVGVDDTTATRRHIVDATLEKRLQKYRDRSGLYHLLWIDQLISPPDLARRYKFLHFGHHHRDDGHGL